MEEWQQSWLVNVNAMDEKPRWRWITDIEEFDRFVAKLTAEEWAQIEREMREGMDIDDGCSE